jgi:hypothetical protein
MFTLAVGIAIGLGIGWNLPQPQWAKDLQAKVTNLFRK